MTARKQCISRRFHFVQPTPVDGYVRITESLKVQNLHLQQDNHAKFHLTLDHVVALAHFAKLQNIDGYFVEKPLHNAYTDGATWEIVDVINGKILEMP